MSHIYILESGSVLGEKGGRFIIEQKGGMIRSIPKESVESISIFGNSSISTPCVQELLTKNIPVCYYSSSGRYFGRLESTNNTKIFLQRKQFQVFDDEVFSLPLAQKIIMAKISNQRVILLRYGKTSKYNVEKAVSQLRLYEGKVVSGKSVSEIIGYEGMSARIYFETLSHIIDREFKFSGRSKRPPKDPFNSMLSFGYTILMYEIMGKIQSAGLNPYYGVIHKIRENHPVLASDLMEEWRAVIIDSTVLSMVQGHEMQIEEFEKNEDNGGILISKQGIRKFLLKLEKKFNSEVSYLKYDLGRCSYRQALNIQCDRLAKAIMSENAEEYEPILIR